MGEAAKLISRVAVVCDLHAEESTLQLCADIVDQIIDRMTKEGVKYIFIAGDTVESRKSQSLATMMSISDMLKKFGRAGINVIIFAGNHDKVEQHSPISYMSLYSGMENVTVVSDFYSFDGELSGYHVMPYFSEKEADGNTSFDIYLNKVIAGMAGKRGGVLITHIDINGGTRNKYDVGKFGVSPSIFEPFDLVISGHYHNRKDLGRVKYIGSAYQADFSEDENKGFVIIGLDGSVDYIHLSFPRYVTADFTLSGDSYISELDKFVKAFVKNNAGCHKRIILHGEDAVIRSVDVNRIKRYGVSVETDIDHSGADSSPEDNGYVRFNEESISDLFFEFAEEEGIDGEKFEYGAGVMNRMLINN